jgi:glycosyltransferase involved in cell wall biosynthesis
MQTERILLIGGWHLLSGLNHRIRHMADHFEKRFDHLDVVGYCKMYGGAPAPLMKKIRVGARNLMRNRIDVRANGGVRHITIRDVCAPNSFEMPIKDLWRYWSLCQCITSPYDAAIIGYPGNAWTASLLKRSGRVKTLIYDDWDYHPGLETDEFHQRMVERREQLCARTADVVITVNGLLGDLRKQQGAKRVEVIPNGLDLRRFEKARKKVSHPPTLLYMGSLSPLWNIDLAIRALPAIAMHIGDVRLLIAGYGPAEPALKQLVRDLALEDRVQFLGTFAYEQLPSLLTQADIGITTALPDSTFRHYASPLKLLEYMAGGLPVIASRLGQTEIILRESNAGLSIGNSVDEFAQAALALFEDQALYRQCSLAAIAYASGFDWGILLDRAFHIVIDAITESQT